MRRSVVSANRCRTAGHVTPLRIVKIQVFLSLEPSGSPGRHDLLVLGLPKPRFLVRSLHFSIFSPQYPKSTSCIFLLYASPWPLQLRFHTYATVSCMLPANITHI